MTTFNGDCLEVMRDFSDNIIDLLFCDLPYGETNCKWDCKINLETFWKEVNRICKLNCPMFFTTTARFGVELINSNPKNFRYDLVWVKSASVGFLNAKKMPMRKHELIYVFYRKLPYYDLSSHTHKFIGIIDRNGQCYGKLDNKSEAYSYNPPLPISVIKTELYNGTTRTEPIYRAEAGLYDPPLPNSILEIKSEKGKHSTQKPVDLIKWILKYYSKEGDTILDPTMGSGTTLIACKQMNRKYIGIEKDEKIYKEAVERLSKI
jgi:site-specific DNA-methyltransferase (adenine-specific)